MWRRKNKQVEQGSDSRRVQRGGGVSPAFSYYTTRTNLTVGEGRRQERPDNREERPKPVGQPWKAQVPFWLFIAVVAVCLVKVVLLTTDPKVVIVGNNSVSAVYQRAPGAYAASAHKLLSGSITSHSKITVDSAGVAEKLKQQFPELESASLTLPLIGSRPILYVEVARPSVILQTNYGNYALNTSGVVLAKLQTLPKDTPQVVDQSGTVPKPGKQFLPSSTVSFIETVQYQLNAAHIAPSAYVLPPQNPYELDVRLEGQSYVIRFNLQDKVLEQSGAAIAAVQQLSGHEPQDYLDVRLLGRVYYK